MNLKLDADFATVSRSAVDWFQSGALDAYGRRNGLRYGQYIWNRHGLPNETWPELFYAEHYAVVAAILIEYFSTLEQWESGTVVLSEKECEIFSDVTVDRD